MSEIYLHIGLHKTGTTFLQENVFKNISEINYVHKPTVKEIPRFLKDGKNLISNEEFSLSMPQKGKNKYYTVLKLKKKYPNAKIIVGSRKTEPFLQSSYSQYIKAGGIRSFKHYKKVFDIIEPKNYIKQIQSMWNNVCIYKQEDLKENPDKVIKELCNFIGCSIPDYDFDTKYNLKLKGYKLHLFRFLNIIMLGPLLRKLIESPYWIITAIPRRLRNHKL